VLLFDAMVEARITGLPSKFLSDPRFCPPSGAELLVVTGRPSSQATISCAAGIANSGAARPRTYQEAYEAALAAPPTAQEAAGDAVVSSPAEFGDNAAMSHLPAQEPVPPGGPTDASASRRALIGSPLSPGLARNPLSPGLARNPLSPGLPAHFHSTRQCVAAYRGTPSGSAPSAACESHLGGAETDAASDRSLDVGIEQVGDVESSPGALQPQHGGGATPMAAAEAQEAGAMVFPDSPARVGGANSEEGDCELSPLPELDAYARDPPHRITVRKRKRGLSKRESAVYMIAAGRMRADTLPDADTNGDAAVSDAALSAGLASGASASPGMSRPRVFGQSSDRRKSALFSAAASLAPFRADSRRVHLKAATPDSGLRNSDTNAAPAAALVAPAAEGCRQRDSPPGDQQRTLLEPILEAVASSTADVADMPAAPASAARVGAKRKRVEFVVSSLHSDRDSDGSSTAPRAVDSHGDGSCAATAISAPGTLVAANFAAADVVEPLAAEPPPPLAAGPPGGEAPRTPRPPPSSARAWPRMNAELASPLLQGPSASKRKRLLAMEAQEGLGPVNGASVGVGGVAAPAATGGGSLPAFDGGACSDSSGAGAIPVPVNAPVAPDAAAPVCSSSNDGAPRPSVDDGMLHTCMSLAAFVGEPEHGGSEDAAAAAAVAKVVPLECALGIFSPHSNAAAEAAHSAAAHAECSESVEGCSQPLESCSPACPAGHDDIEGSRACTGGVAHVVAIFTPSNVDLAAQNAALTAALAEARAQLLAAHAQIAELRARAEACTCVRTVQRETL